MTAYSAFVRLLLGLVLLVGCGKPVSTPSTPRAAKPSVDGEGFDPAVAVDEISEADQMQFVERLEAATLASDVRAFNRCVDWGTLIDKVFEPLSVESKIERSMKQGMLTSINSPTGIGAQIIDGVREEGTYQFIRLHQRDGVPHALFRLLAEDGMNYHDYQLSRRGQEVVATDMYIYMAGENLSTTFRRAAVPGVAQLSKNWIQKLGSSDQAFFKEYDKLTTMAERVRKGDGRGALGVFHSMSKKMQEIKPIQLLRYRAAMLVDDQELIRAYDDLERLYPKDEALSLLSIDAFILRKQYDRALEAVDALDKSVGGDPCLNTVRSNVSALKGDTQNAERYARKAVELDPGSMDNHWALLGVLIAAEDYSGVYEALNQMDRTFPMEWEDLSQIDDYEGFAASEYGQRWLVDHGFRKPAEEPGASKVEDPSLNREEPFGQMPTDSDEYLEWTDKTGKFTVEAQFVAMDAGGVTLRKKDGEQVVAPLEKLSRESVRQAGECMVQQMRERTRKGSPAAGH